LAKPLRLWAGSIMLAAGLGVAYFLAARLSLALLTKPDGVAVFWPAAGVASGVLIAVGPTARWPVIIGAMAATIAANLLGDRSLGVRAFSRSATLAKRSSSRASSNARSVRPSTWTGCGRFWVCLQQP
jgi:integral membrane sensor domain MASE1